MTHYGMLGVTPAATQEEIETAFRKLAHAANTPDDPEHAAAVRNAKYIAEAYRVLRDPERREEYARLLAGHQREAGTGAISEEEFHSWLQPGMTIEQGIAAKLAAEQALQDRVERDRQLAQAQRLDNLRTVRSVVILAVVAVLMLWVALVFVYPHLELGPKEATHVEVQAAVYSKLSVLPSSEARLVPMKGSNLQIFLSKSAFESVPYPDRDAFVRGIGRAWCDAVDTWFVPSVDFRDIRTGGSLASYNCVFSGLGRNQ
jgi:hypothetical protein